MKKLTCMFCDKEIQSLIRMYGRTTTNIADLEICFDCMEILKLNEKAENNYIWNIY